MAQSQQIAPSPGAAGGAGRWRSAETGGVEPIDIWSQLQTRQITRKPSTFVRAPDHGEIAQVLSSWRAAERRLDEHIEASPMRSLIQSEIARLRAEYQILFARKR